MMTTVIIPYRSNSIFYVLLFAVYFLALFLLELMMVPFRLHLSPFSMNYVLRDSYPSFFLKSKERIEISTMF